MQIEVHTAEPLAPGPSRLEAENAIAKLKKYKLPGSDKIPDKLIQAGGKMLLSVIHKLINSIWNMEELPYLCLLLYQFTKSDKTDCNNYCGTSLLSTSFKILLNILHSRISL
jgi:hypothetical protein